MKHLAFALAALYASVWLVAALEVCVVYRMVYGELVWRLSERWGLGW